MTANDKSLAETNKHDAPDSSNFELPLSQEISAIGIAKMHVKEGSLFIDNKKGEVVKCHYFESNFPETSKRFRAALIDSHWLDEKTANKAVRLFADLWRRLVEKGFLGDGNKNRNATGDSVVEKSLKAQIYTFLPETVKASLADSYWELIRYNPPKFVVGDKQFRQIVSADYTAKKQRNDEDETAGIDIHDPSIQVRQPQESIKPSLKYRSLIVNALPVTITLHDPPALASQDAVRYTMRFVTHSNAQFILERKTIDQIISYLKERSLVVARYGATEALSLMVTHFVNNNMITVDKSVDFEGYYYYDADIQRSRVEDKHMIRTKEECIQIADFLEKWSEFYVWNYKDRRIDRRDLLATAIKWTVVAPFNFVLKQLGMGYMNWFDMSGERDGGKSALSNGMLEIHGNAIVDAVKESVYNLSAGSMNTDAKLGNGLSKTTYPIVISEFGQIEKYGRDEKLVETVKNAIERLTSRSGRKDGKYDAQFLSLSPVILNGNSVISKKGELLKRLHVNKYSQEDRHDKGDVRTKEFNDLMEQRRYELRILGDWTINYIFENRQELLLSKKYDAYQLMDVVINAFYQFAGIPVPEWITKWIEESELNELDVDEESLIRAILFDFIHTTIQRNNFLLKGEGIDNQGKLNLDARVRLCLNNGLLGFSRQVLNQFDTFDIDSSVLLLFEQRLPDLTLKKLGEKMGLQYTKQKGRWVLRCTGKNLIEFIENATPMEESTIG